MHRLAPHQHAGQRTEESKGSDHRALCFDIAHLLTQVKRSTEVATQADGRPPATSRREWNAATHTAWTEFCDDPDATTEDRWSVFHVAAELAMLRARRQLGCSGPPNTNSKTRPKCSTVKFKYHEGRFMQVGQHVGFKERNLRKLRGRSYEME